MRDNKPKRSALGTKHAMPGRHADSEVKGLYLYVRPSGSRSWVLRLARTLEGGKVSRHDYGLGSVTDLSLAKAREKALLWRDWFKRGWNPVEVQIIEDRKAAEEMGLNAVTFTQAADAFFNAHSPSWRNPKHRDQWRNTIATYVAPHIGEMAVKDVSSSDIIRSLSPVWLAKPETARRIRQRIGAVLDFAHAQGWRTDVAPMRAVAAGLPKKQPKGSNFAAVDYDNAADVIALLRKQARTTGRQALEFTILTAARSGETRGATWGEIDLVAKTWTIPAARMKMKDGGVHVVPLPPTAFTLLEKLNEGRAGKQPSEIIFKGNAGRAISDMTMGKAQKEVAPDTTVHGWRATFRTWIADKTNFTRDIAEKALAHSIKSDTEASYNRGELLDKRRELMEAWDRYLAGKSNVIELAKTANE